MKSVIKGIAALAVVLTAGGLPQSASAESYHEVLQDFDVWSNGWNITCIYDEFNVQVWNTGWLYGPNTYTVGGGYLDETYRHWVYDFNKASWDFIKYTEDSDVYIYAP